MTAFLFVILFGLGIDFGIHMFARYLEVRMDKTDVRMSIETMLSQTGQAILTGGDNNVHCVLFSDADRFQGPFPSLVLLWARVF